MDTGLRSGANNKPRTVAETTGGESRLIRSMIIALSATSEGRIAALVILLTDSAYCAVSSPDPELQVRRRCPGRPSDGAVSHVVMLRPRREKPTFELRTN